jgi:hypothetical protein
LDVFGRKSEENNKVVKIPSEWKPDGVTLYLVTPSLVKLGAGRFYTRCFKKLVEL